MHHQARPAHPLHLNGTVGRVMALALGGTAQVFTAVLAMFSGLGRKLDDVAETIERPGLERVA